MLAVYLSMIETNEDKSKFEQLYRQYAQDMYSVAYSILRNKEDAEDAVHQSFIKIAENFTKISSLPCQKIRSFIVIISGNTAKNIYNSNKRRAEHTVTLIDEIIDDERAFDKDDYFELTSAIKRLPQKYKDVIYLYYLEEFSVKEIEKLLDITPDNVYQRLLRAKKMLRDILEGSDSNE